MQLKRGKREAISPKYLIFVQAYECLLLEIQTAQAFLIANLPVAPKTGEAISINTIRMMGLFILL